MRSNVGVGPVGEAVHAASAGVAAMVAATRGGDLRWVSHDALAALLVQTRALQARLESVALAAVREVDVRGSYVSDGALSAGAWARMHARVTPSEATAMVRTARVLGSGAAPGTADALAAGEIDAGHVRVIAAAVQQAPAGAVAVIEPEVLEVAREADPRAVAAVMRRFTDALDPEAADAAALARYGRRGITLAALPDGTMHISGLADEVTASVVATAIDAASPPVTGDSRTAAQRRMDGLADICRRYLAAPDAPRAAGGHPQVILTLDAATLAGPGSGHGGPGGTLSWVGPVAGSTARRVACDAEVTMVLIDQHGRVTHEQVQRRLFTPAQRRAMIARDGDRCPVPFCDRPVAWSDAHHLRAWGEGGPTTVANGALPCAAHHTLLHEGGWSLHRQPDGRYLIRHRDGKTIGPEPHPPGHHRPTPHPRR
jgi:hypothetical protein